MGGVGCETLGLGMGSRGSNVLPGLRLSCQRVGDICDLTSIFRRSWFTPASQIWSIIAMLHLR